MAKRDGNKPTKKQQQADRTDKKSRTAQQSDPVIIAEIDAASRSKDTLIDGGVRVVLTLILVTGAIVGGLFVLLPVTEALAGKNTVADINLVWTVAVGGSEACGFLLWGRSKQGQVDDNREELIRLRTRCASLEEQNAWLRGELGK